MPKIKNMGSATMKFGEGIIVTGSAGTDTPTLVVSGSATILGSLTTKQRHINTAKYSLDSADQQYVRWNAAGSNSSPGVNNKFLAPCDGELLSVTIRATAAANGTNIAFHKASDGTENLNTNAVETVGVDMSAANTGYQAQFSGSNFSAGEILGISLNPTNGFGNVDITCIWEFDFTAQDSDSGGGSGGVSIPNNCLLFLDASDTNSYNGSGTTWTDLSGQGKHATLVNSPTWNNNDKVFEFSGSSSQHMTVPTGFADFTSGATFFFVADLGTGNHWERLVDFSGGSSTPLNVGRKQSTTTMKLEYYNPSKTGTETNIILNNTLANYVVTTDGSYAKFYRNGSLIANNSYDKVPDNNDRTQNYIGRSRSSGDAYYEGEIAVVAIFNRALSSSEITDLYNHYNSLYSF